MKITIKQKEGKGFSLWLPTLFLKSKLLLNSLFKNNESMDLFISITPTIYKELKRYIRKKGHFNLVELESEEEGLVIIKI